MFVYSCTSQIEHVAEILYIVIPKNDIGIIDDYTNYLKIWGKFKKTIIEHLKNKNTSGQLYVILSVIIIIYYTCNSAPNNYY